MDEFDTKTIEDLGFYVYALIDPRTGKPFYIGKGCGNRIFAHAKDALLNPDSSDKLDTIREITELGLGVESVIVQHGLTEGTAFAVEAALIDFSRHFSLGLSNKVLGQNSNAFGIMTTAEIKRKYEAVPITRLDEGCVIININKTYRRAGGAKSYYDATRESWAISNSRIPTLKFVLSEYAGFIVEVFEVEENGWYQVKDPKGRLRWGFRGRQAPDAVRDRYLNRSIMKKKGAANPITYRLSLTQDYEQGLQPENP